MLSFSKWEHKIAMRLELGVLDIKDIQFADRTTVAHGVLHVNRDELQELLLEDRRFSQVDIELAHPGEKCRILRVSDVIEPRAKTGGGEDFPGALGKQVTVGDGSTCVLRGAAVVMSDFSETGQFGRDLNGEIIDMSGPAAEASIYGKIHNVVVLPYPVNGVSPDDYRVALKTAGLKTAVYLAKAGKSLKPDKIEVYHLPPLTEVGIGLEGLPKVAYIFQVLSTQHGVVPGEAVLYGSNIEGTVPIILHPNEILDGAITSPYRAFAGQTYLIQNHPIIKELFRRHGRELCFAGVIITLAHHNEPESERIGTIAANLAKWVIGADGVVLTKTGGGAPEAFMARTAQRCEELGIKTAIAMLHMSADPSYTKFECSVNFNMPRVDAIVSMGTPNMPITLPPMERIIGRPVELPEGLPISGEIEKILLWIKGATSQLGDSRLTLVPY